MISNPWTSWLDSSLKEANLPSWKLRIVWMSALHPFVSGGLIGDLLNVARRQDDETLPDILPASMLAEMICAWSQKKFDATLGFPGDVQGLDIIRVVVWLCDGPCSWPVVNGYTYTCSPSSQDPLELRSLLIEASKTIRSHH